MWSRQVFGLSTYGLECLDFFGKACGEPLSGGVQQVLLASCCTVVSEELLSTRNSCLPGRQRGSHSFRHFSLY